MMSNSEQESWNQEESQQTRESNEEPEDGAEHNWLLQLDAKGAHGNKWHSTARGKWRRIRMTYDSGASTSAFPPETCVAEIIRDEHTGKSYTAANKGKIVDVGKEA